MKHLSLRKSLVCGVLLAVFLAAIPGMALADGLYGLVKGGNLHLRSSNSASSASLGLYPSGTWVEVLESNSAWTRVCTDTGKLGYMATNYLTLDSSSVLSTGTVRNPNGYVNLRASASMNAAVLGRYEPGTQVDILARHNDGWTYVMVNGQIGYMVSDFVISSQQTQSGHIVSKYGSRINLRSGPMSGASIITSLPTGTQVSVLIAGRDWHKITTGEYTGYIAAQYVSTAASSSTTAVVKNPRSTQVLNLRAQPSTDAKVLGYYSNGTRVSVVSKGSTWSEVYVGSKHGYMMTKYLDFSASTGTSATLYNPNGGSVVNMRSAATLQSSIIGVYAVGTQVTVLRRDTDWCYVTIGSQSGYVSTYFLR